MRWPLPLLLAGCGFAQAPFLATYCGDCHGAKVQMADRRFDQLRLPVRDADTLLLLQAAVDRLNLGTMPPRGVKQPQPDEKRAAIETITKLVSEGRAASVSTGGQTVLRRLNKREYLNTVGDLFAMNMSMFDPASRFPHDQTNGHMDNTGDTLVTSGYLLEQYLDAASQIVEKVFRNTARPEPRTWTFRGPFRQQPELDYAHSAVFQQKYMVLYETPRTVHEEGAYGPLYAFAEGVPADGFYEVSVQAEAVNRKHPYDPKLFGMDPDAPFRLGIVPGNAKVGALHHEQPLQPRLGEVTLGDNGPEWHTFRVWLDAGYSPRFTFPNGNADGRGSFNRILNKYRTLLPPDQRNFTPGIRPARPHLLKYGFLPQIRIHEVKVRGPLVEQWPPAGQQIVLGGRAFEAARTREILERFATRAYRRPARKDEVDRLMSVVDRRTREGIAPFEAMKDGLKAVLCSPAFLYLSEDVAPRLSAYALASRLSYFLWSTMPDVELLRAAQSGELLKTPILLSQTRRMLSDPKSKAFIAGFLDSWLNLRSLGDMPPDRDHFGAFYTNDLKEAMLTETRMFTCYLLDQNLSIANFLDSTFTFVNKPLARMYGMDAGMSSVDGQLFRQVKIADPRRGGLLGQGSVLTVSANGIETSPVTRGVWVLDTIFGTPPPPPPDNVPPIDPDVRGAKSMREVLTKHRASAACMSCHVKIDPPGFALENFDPIGAWRAKYPNGIAIDASGELPGGQAFTDIVSFKKALLGRQQEFARALTGQLLAYGCGRRMEASDRPKIDALVEELERKGSGFRDLMELVVASGVFRDK
jgi:hypothetical protein